MMIKLMTKPGDPASDRDPVAGLWYHGVNAAGQAGALFQYLGWGSYETGEGKTVDPTSYDHLVEHDK